LSQRLSASLENAEVSGTDKGISAPDSSLSLESEFQIVVNSSLTLD